MTAALPLGASSVTAVYSGDTNFAASTSSGVSETVNGSDFTFVLVPSSGSPAVQTVAQGGTATYNFTVSPSLASFPQAVTFTVSGLPPGATYTLTPSSIPAGGGATPMTLVVTTTNSLAQLSRHGDRMDEPYHATAAAVALCRIQAPPRMWWSAHGAGRAFCCWYYCLLASWAH